MKNFLYNLGKKYFYSSTDISSPFLFLQYFNCHCWILQQFLGFSLEMFAVADKEIGELKLILLDNLRLPRM